MDKKVEDIANFIFGQSVAEAFLNFLSYELGYCVRRTGTEISNGFSNLSLRKLRYKANDQETLKNLKSDQLEPDAKIISPKSNKISHIEIKTRSTGSLESFLANNYSVNEFIEIKKYYPNVRMVYIDLENKRIRSICCANKELTYKDQFENWNKPASWIEGVKDQKDFDVKSKYFFQALLVGSQKVVDKSIFWSLIRND